MHHARLTLPRINMPNRTFSFDPGYYTDSDDEEVEYGLDLGAESPPATEDDVLAWEIKSAFMELQAPTAESPSSCHCSEHDRSAGYAQNSYFSLDINRIHSSDGHCLSCKKPHATQLPPSPHTPAGSDSDGSTSDEETESFEDDLVAFKVASLSEPSTILSRLLGTLGLMIFLYALTFRST